MNEVKIIAITFQNTIDDNVEIGIDGKALPGIVGPGSHLEYVETQGTALIVEISSLNSISAMDKIQNINHGDQFTYLIKRDSERELKLVRKFGFEGLH